MSVSTERLKEVRNWFAVHLPRQDFVAICDELLALREWQPIETAPRDWLFLVRLENGFYDLAHFNGLYWFDQDMRSLRGKAVEWMPIPGAMPAPHASAPAREEP